MTHRPLLPAHWYLCGLLVLLLPGGHVQAEDTLSQPISTSLPQGSTDEEAVDGLSQRPRWHLQSNMAVASESDFGPALLFYYEQPDQRTNLGNLSVGRQVGKTLLGWPAEVVAYGGIQYYGEDGFQPDVIGGTIYIKAYQQFNIGKRQLPLRIGLGEGLSYASRIPIVEVEDFLPETSAKLTNYLEWTMQTSLNHLLGRGGQRFSAGIKDIYIGYSVFHRSTVFGLFASKGGGVNYMGLGVELVLD